jgi:predicted nucleic acid-binding protein
VTGLVYIDTSAFLRAFLRDASDHSSMRTILDDQDSRARLVSSELLCVEADRAAIRLEAESPELTGLRKMVDTALGHLQMIAITHEVVDAARDLPQIVKSLDAIHIATAELLEGDLDAILTYDAGMARVAAERGLRCVTANQLLSAMAAENNT